jgi:hypothetical protein
MAKTFPVSERGREGGRERERERERELYWELFITGGLGRRPRTDSASPHYGLFDSVTAYMAKTFPGL